MLSFLKTLLGIGSGVSWIVYAVIFGLGLTAGGGGTWRVMQWHVNEVVAERDGAVSQRDIFKASADSLAATHTDDLATITACRGVVADQSAAVARMQFSLDQTNDAAAKQAAQSDAETAALNGRIADLQAWAASHQDKVCKLSPEMQERAAGLWK